MGCIRRRRWAIGVLVGALVLAWTSSASAGDDPYLVHVSAATPAEIGDFSERAFSGNAAEGLRFAFGDPNSVIRVHGTCTMRWSGLGLRALLTNYAQTHDPCNPGYFLQAQLVGSSWHTTKGLRIGSPSSVARRQSVCGRGKLHCQTSGYPHGYILGVHRIDCARGLFPNVIAVIRHSRVVSLWVYSHGCE